MGDFNNDGYPDLYLTTYSQFDSPLYRGNGTVHLRALV